MYSEQNCNKIINLFKNTKTAFQDGIFTNGVGFEAAYHTLYFGNKRIEGQRDNKIRYEIIKKHLDFSNKNVIDFGCNTGGLLREFSNDINYGIGFDYDSRCINAANCLNYYNNKKLSFYTHDFDKHKLNLIKNYIPNEMKIDITVCCAMGSWVKKWDKLYRFIADLSDTMIFEANNKNEGKPQLKLLESLFDNIEMISEKSLDDPSNNLRQLYLLTRNKV